MTWKARCGSNCKQERLAGFDGHLTETVEISDSACWTFGQGGHFEVRQAEVSPAMGPDYPKRGDERESSPVRDHRCAEEGTPSGLPPGPR